jgi:LemA protein
VARDEALQAQGVERAYRGRAGVLARLVGSVEAAGACAPELGELAAARAEVERLGDAAFAALASEPEASRRFEAAERALGAALDRLLAAAARQAELSVAPAFLRARGQLDASLARLGVERMRFNEVAEGINTKRLSLPTGLVATLVGERLRPKGLFAERGLSSAPAVR